MPKKESFWSRLVDYLGFGPEEDEEFEDEAEEETAEDDWQTEIKRPADRRAPVVPITAVPQKQPTLKVLVVEPRSFEEVQTIVDQMRSRRPVILNLESLDKELAQKILNFLNGAIYALGGETQRVSGGIFFFAPQGVDISTMGRGITGTAIGGGAVDLPPGVLEKLMGTATRGGEQSSATASGISKEEMELLYRATGRRRESERVSEGRSRFDWRSK